MKLLYGTTNQAKLDSMRRITKTLGLEIVGLNELGQPLPIIDENGKSPLENAAIKAKAYYEAFGMPVFSCDSGLYFDDLEDALQPGTHIRRVNGKELTDEEMTAYYADLARKHNDRLVGRYRNAICLMLDEETVFQSMDEALATEAFILCSIPHEKRVKGFPLDCLSLDIATGKYYYDLLDRSVDQSAVEQGFLKFFTEKLRGVFIEEKEMCAMEKTIKLYPSIAPGSEKLTIKEELFAEEKNGVRKEYVQNVTSPELISYVPENGTEMSAVIIIPGGAFMRQVLCHEGRDVAQWLNNRGIAAFILKTRLPVDEHSNKYDVLLMDAQRAVRTVRAHAAEWGIRKDSIGVMGFSAGGYQTALIATGFDVKLRESPDAIDSYSARPDFCVLGYPAVAQEVQENRDPSGNFPIAYYEKEQLAKYKPHEMLNKNTPPLFIFDADDDGTTPPENSVLLYLAARKRQVPAELHIFKTGKHGFGLGNDEEQTGQWKALFWKWAETVGIRMV